jgi:hypothetical protein
MVQLVTAIEKISQEGSPSSQSIAASLKNLEDEVNRQSKELRDLKNIIGAKKGSSPPTKSKRGRALDGHAWELIDIIRENQSNYNTNEIVNLLGLNKTTVIGVMKRAAALEPDHLKLTRGKRRKIFLEYVP